MEEPYPPTQEQAQDDRTTTVYNIVNADGILHLITSESAAQQIARLEAANERMRMELDRKDSAVFNLRFRSYLESLAEAEKNATGAPPRSGTSGLLRGFFGKALNKALSDPSHPLYNIQQRYCERPGQLSSHVKQKVDDLFPHFSRNIHKYFESGDEFAIPQNLDMLDALLAELLVALKPTGLRDSYGRVDGSVERTRFV